MPMRLSQAKQQGSRNRHDRTELCDLFRDLDRRIGLFDKKIDRIFHGREACRRIARIKGVGPKTATAIVAAIGDGSEFKNGRHLAAWVGLVP
jgi:transposase